MKRQEKVRWLYSASSDACDELFDTEQKAFTLSEVLGKVSKRLGLGVHILRLKKEQGPRSNVREKACKKNRS